MGDEDNEQHPEVKMPLIGPESDVAAVTRDFLSNLNLLPNRTDLENADGAKAALFGPPQSVALIEAGATALSKGWAAGASTVLVGS